MIYIRQRKDVDYEIEKLVDTYEDFINQLYEAVDNLKDYANESIFIDSSKGCYEDNQSYVVITRDDLIKQLEGYKKEIDEYIKDIKEIEPER